jgi:putative ABC transport system substrate-binding protein
VERRAFVAGSLGLLAVPLAAGAQRSGQVPRIGYIGNGSPTTPASPQLEAFRQGLRELGYIEGQTLTIEYRWAEGNVDRLPALAAELVRLKVDVIVLSGTPAIRAAQQATSSIPIVIGVILINPVDAGFVASLARPGGNITGLASQYEEIVTKQVQLLAETVPKLRRVVFLHHASMPQGVTARAAVGAADQLGLKTRVLEVSEVAQFEGAFRTARDDRAQALLVLPSPFFNAHRRDLIKLAASYRLPAFYEFKEYVAWLRRIDRWMAYANSVVEE